MLLITAATLILLSACGNNNKPDEKHSSKDQILSYMEAVNADGFVNCPECNQSSLGSAASQNLLPADLPTDDSLCIAVMGFALNKDGSMRDELVLRLITALNCAKQYPKAYVLVTGGGTASQNKTATEADKMAQWLIDNVLSKDRLIIENHSMTTVENALYSYDIIRKNYPQITDIAVVTSDYHIPLSCLLFESQFILAAEKDGHEVNIQVSANAACHPESPYTFTKDDQLRWLDVLAERNESKLQFVTKD